MSSACGNYSWRWHYSGDSNRRANNSGTTDGMDAYFKTVEDTAGLLVKVFDSATRETDVFMNFDGATNPW
jgi:hypothetical protein